MGCTVARPSDTAIGGRLYHPTPSAWVPTLAQNFGWAAAAALLGHIAVVATLQPAFWRSLTPAIPVEIVAGLVAASSFFVTLAAQRLSSLRRRLRPFLGQQIHRVAGYVLVAAASAHIALIAGLNLVAAFMVLSGLAFILFEGFLRERHVIALAFALGLSIASMVELPVGTLATTRLAALRRAPIDHARFLHTDHFGLSCTGCHHNFIDRTGSENCLNCHKRISLSEASRIDRTFHAFCSDCHRMDKWVGRKSGPIDDCSGCHTYNAAVGLRSNTFGKNVITTFACSAHGIAGLGVIPATTER